MKLLLSSGRVDINKGDLSGRRAIHHACEQGYGSVVELLLPVIDDHNARDDSGATPFQYTAKKGDVAVVKLLPKSGKADADSIRTLLLRVTEKGHAKVAMLLLENSANLNSRDNYAGHTFFGRLRKGMRRW